jgi:hypothetical protein
VAQTYADVWRAVKLHASAAPLFLVREWVNDAWKTLTRHRGGQWVFLRTQAALTIAAARSVAVTVTTGSTTVTSAGLFVAGDAGRQLRIATFPFYTITVVTDANTITLDRAYGEDSATATAQIFDGYFVTPADFGQFDLIADPYNQRRLAFWISQDELNLLDPTRQAGDTGPRLLATAMPSTATATLGRIQYEYWPRPTSARSFPYYYFKRGANLADSFTFSGVLADAGDVLQKGALAQAARWPGTSDKPNPYFNLGLADRLDKDFADGMQKLSLADDNQQGSDLQRVHWDRWPLADLAYNDASLRASDATVDDLF